MQDRDLYGFRRDMRALTDNARNRPLFTLDIVPAVWQPNIDVYETRGAVVVLVELAGVAPETIDIAIQGPVLRVAGSRQLPLKAEYTQVHRLEVAQGKFERRVALPRAVDESRAEATYGDGFLEIVLPFAIPYHPPIGRDDSKERKKPLT